MDAAPQSSLAATPPAAGAGHGKRWPRRVALAVAAVLVAALAALALAISTYDWNRARGWLAQHVSEAIGRRVEIRGDLALTWVRAGPGESGIARWIPWPQLDAHDVAVGNPDWVDTPDMLAARHLRVRMRVLPLLNRSLSFDSIEIDGLDAGLVLDAQNRNNWTFTPRPREDGAAPWQVDIRRLRLEHARLTLADAPDKLDLEVLAASLDEPPYGLGFSIRGKYRGKPVTGRGRAGSLLALREGGQAYPLDIALDSGPIHVALTGTLTDPRAPPVFDMKLDLAMHSMADLYPLTGVALPDTPPFKTSGRLYGGREHGTGRVTYENFTGRAGASDLSGTLAFQLTRPRPKLSGSLHSKLLRLADLAPSVGAPASPAAPAAKSGRVLPSERFRVERLDAMDADVEFSAGQIVKSAGVPMDSVHTRIALADSVLTLDPLKFGLAGGSVNGSVVMDSRAADLKTRLRASLDQLQ
ncbi:MAG: AsmA family protein, partial [Rhodocyclaceae bacterium]|nr:AsmA family protein [Rhodocyclaceae bacterium]